MPRTKPLTEAQREAEEMNRLCKEILDRLNERRGRDRLNVLQFCELIGISRVTWWKWGKEGLTTCEFGRLHSALNKIGYRLTLEPRNGGRSA